MQKFKTGLWGLLIFSLPFQVGKHFWFNFSLNNGIRIDYLAPTIYLQDIVILLLAITEAVMRIKGKPSKADINTPKNLILPIALIAVNLFFANNKYISVYYWLRCFEVGLLGYFVYYNAETVKALFRKLVIPVIVIQLFLSVRQIVYSSSIGSIFWWLGERSFNIVTPGIAKGSWFGVAFLRPYGSFSHPNSLAGFFLIIIIIGWFLINTNFLKHLVLVLSSVIVFLSFSRIAWLSLIFIYFFIHYIKYIKNNFYKYRTNVLKYIFIVYPVLSLLILLLPSADVKYSKILSVNNSIIIRQHLIVDANEIITKNLSNLFFGVGLGNFIPYKYAHNINQKYWYGYQPVHNVLILWLVETGLVGCSGLFWLYHIVKTIGFSHQPNNKAFNNIFLFIFIILFTGFFDHYWLTLIQNQLLIGFSFGLLLSNNKPLRDKSLGIPILQ